MSKKSAERSRSERARAEIQRQHDAERRRKLLVGGVAAAVLAVVVVVGFLVNSSRDETGETPSTVPSGLTDEWSVVVGDADAPTTLTVYEDLQCPVCAQFEQATGDAVQAAVEDGRVKVEYRMVSFLDPASTNQYSSRALNALMVVLDTAGVDAFTDFHQLLYERQPAEGGPGPDDATLVDWAVESGADADAVTRPIQDEVYRQWVVNATDAMSKNGVNGTPTVFIDGERTSKDPRASAEAVLAAVQ